MKRTIDSLKQKDYIAFPWSYYPNDEKHIEVTNITSIHESTISVKDANDKKLYLVHFLYGYKSMSEFLKEEDIIAIGNQETGKGKIRGWTGKFDILQPNHEVLIKQNKE